MKILQIVPRLPPAIDGLGDYALNLARQLRQDFGVETHFLVGNPDWIGATETEGFPVIQLKQRSARTFLSQLPRKVRTILLHYVGYGYAKRGCPLWLVDGLRRWQSEHLQARLVTMFHEVYASGKFWTSAFWLSPLQRNLAARLARLSDACLTSKQRYADILSQLSQGKHPQIPTLPVFSNIGEPQQPPPLAERTRRIVVFGHKNSRSQVYQQCLPVLEQVCKMLEIREIYDIGVPTGLKLSPVNGVPIEEKGVTEAAVISEILLDSVGSFSNFPLPNNLAKSGVFAAYCCHRLIPIMTLSSAAPVDGLEAGKHYWAADFRTRQLCLEAGQIIADNAHAWYQTHNLSIQAKVFATIFGQSDQSKC